MGKNDFDIDFDFEKEYGFDPKAFLGAEEHDDNIDLSEFSDEDLGLSFPKDNADTKNAPDDPEDFSLDGLDLDGDFDLEDQPDEDLDDFLNMGSQNKDYGEEEPEADFSEFSDDVEYPEDAEPEQEEGNEDMEYPEDSERLDPAESADQPVD